MIMMLKCCRKIWIHCQIGKKHGKYVLMQINALFLKSLMPINMYSTIVTSWGHRIILQETNSHPYLGVEITKDLKWKTHVNQISAKSNRALGFIKRNLSNCNEKIKLTTFNPNTFVGLVGKVQKNFLPKEERREDKEKKRAQRTRRAQGSTWDLLRARRGSPAARHGVCLVFIRFCKIL